MDLIDFRSDTVTKPDEGMRRAMAEAEVGDDVYGEDPTIQRLEERIAQLLGKEAAVWTPSGVMANQIAVGSLVGPGDELIAEEGSHVICYEGAAIAALWGAQTTTVAGRNGRFSVAALESLLRGGDPLYSPLQKAVALENTHNRSGGSSWPIEELESVAQAAHTRGLTVHLDGARLWNAHAASGIALHRYAATADTVAVCLSKGLGAPAGSLVASTRARMPLLRRLRKRLGGGMRQVGIFAAAGLYALEHNLSRLPETHQAARKLAEGLSNLPGLEALPPDTNMVIAKLSSASSRAFVAAARKEGVLCGEWGPDSVRLVTHLDASLPLIPAALERLRRAAAVL